MQVSVMELARADASGVELETDRVRVFVAPELGYAGRPSSAYVRRSIENSLLQSQMELLSMDLDASSVALKSGDFERPMPASALSFNPDD